MPSKGKQKRKATKKKKSKKKIRTMEEEEALIEKLEKFEKKRKEMIERIKKDFDEKATEREAIKKEIRDKEKRRIEKELSNRDKPPDEKKMVEIRKDMKSVIEAGVEKVNALTIVAEKVKFDGKATMTIGGVKYKLKRNVHMVGWGREALMLGAAFERVIGKQLKKGFLVVPRKTLHYMWQYPLWLPKLDTRISYFEVGTGGLPDEKTVEAARKIGDYCKKLKKRDILVVVLSGGTDDLLCFPKGSIRIRDKMNLLTRLRAANATPKEINTVRKKLSAVRGGGLARLAYPAKVITLVMSDMPGDPIDQIAGAPTVNEPKRDAALSILERYKLHDSVPTSIKDVLDEKAPTTPDNLVDENRKFKFVDYYVIANLADAIQGMTVGAFKVGLVSVSLSPSVLGTVREVSQTYAKIACLMILAVEGKITKLDMYESMRSSYVLPLTEEKVNEIFPSKEKWGLGLCLLLGGYPTVDIKFEVNVEEKKLLDAIDEKQTADAKSADKKGKKKGDKKGDKKAADKKSVDKKSANGKPADKKSADGKPVNKKLADGTAADEKPVDKTNDAEKEMEKKSAAVKYRGGPNQELALYFSLDWYLKVKEYPILNEYVVWFLGASTNGIDGNSKVAGAYGYGSLGPSIFKRYKEVKESEETLSLKVRNLSRLKPGSEEQKEASKMLEKVKDEKAKLALILPDYSLRKHNTNFMFMNINDGDELLDLGYTYTNVRDIHIIRIARFQCNCDGSCLGKGELSWQSEICKDKTCSANRNNDLPPPPKPQCCVRSARPKVKIY